MKVAPISTFGAVLLTWGVLVLLTPVVGAQSTGDVSNLIGSIRLTDAVLANGRAIPAGIYQVRLTGDKPPTAVGASPDAEEWVEFVRAGRVVGREVATIVSDADINTIRKGPQPSANESKIERLRGGGYVRAWFHRHGSNYIVNMPPVH